MSQKIVRKFKSTLFDLWVIIRDFIQNSLGGGYWCPRWLRVGLYSLMGNKIHTFRINPGCFIGGNKLSVGKGAFISYDNFFDLTDEIVIGNNVRIAMRSTFITSSHEIAGDKQRAGKATHAPIHIGDGCWIGGNVTILPGVSIGEGTVVAAGAVVTKNCEANSIYAGVPAKKIKVLSEE